MKRNWENSVKTYPKKIKHAKMKPYNRKDNESAGYNRYCR